MTLVMEYVFGLFIVPSHLMLMALRERREEARSLRAPQRQWLVMVADRSSGGSVAGGVGAVLPQAAM
jgi:hypothetical protein